jgi:LuxR family transcriptional regulator, maltose regulon positive regulatory protein
MREVQPSSAVVSHWNPAPSERARLLLAQGAVGDAEQWTEERGLRAEDDVGYAREQEYLVLARVLLARSDPERALRLLTALENRADAQGRTESLIRIRAVRSLALQAAGDHQDALATLADALELARPQGYVRSFADEGPPMTGLLRSLMRARQRGRAPAASPAAREHLNRVLSTFQPPDKPAVVAAASGLLEPLTGRELRCSAWSRRAGPTSTRVPQLIGVLGYGWR